jgi:hypothetical protein
MDKYSFHHHLRGVYAPSKRTRECVRFTVPKYPLFADKTHRLLKDTIFGSSGTFPLGCFGTSGLGGNKCLPDLRRAAVYAQLAVAKLN